MDPNSVSQVVDSVEKDLLAEIVANLKRNKLEPAKAQALAKEFLSHLPPKDFNSMVAILREMSGQYDEAKGVLIKYEAIAQKREDLEKANLMAQHISQGQIEQAIQVAKEDQQK